MLTEVPDDSVVSATRGWVDKAVIGLNLCPFARAVQARGQVRYVHSRARNLETLLAHLVEELRMLDAAEPAILDTTLLIHPDVLENFLEFNDFLALANGAVHALGLEGEIQIASFHPHYRFAGTASNAIENYSNRSPFPTLHLLRESSIDRAVAAIPDAADIYQRNIETLRRLGHAGWLGLFSDRESI